MVGNPAWRCQQPNFQYSDAYYENVQNVDAKKLLVIKCENGDKNRCKSEVWCQGTDIV